MKATEAKLLAFLQKSPQFVISIYQHTDILIVENEAEGLLDEIIRGAN